MQREFPLKVGISEAPCLAGRDELNAHIFREPHFGFLEDLFQAGETGEWELADRNRTDLPHRRLVQCRATAFFVDQDKHAFPRLTIDQATKGVQMLRAAQPVVTGFEQQFDGKFRILRQHMLYEGPAALGFDHRIL